MKQSRVLLDFPEMGLADFLILCMYVSLMLFANVLFVSPPVTKVEYDTLIKDFQTKYVAALRGYDPVKNQLRDEAYKILMATTRQLASFTDMICMGDRIKLLLSGFNVYTPVSHTGRAVFSVILGAISGQVIATWGSEPNFCSYVIRYSIDEEGLRDVYTQIGIGTIGLTINGLTPGKVYLFSLAVVYSDHQGEFCAPLSLMVV